MDNLDLEALTRVLNESAQRSRTLIDRVAQQINIDWATGQVRIVDEAEIVSAFRDIKGADSEDLAQSFVGLLLDGYAVLDQGRVGVRDPFGIPWRSLAHGPTLAAITVEGWELLGITPWSSVNSIQQALTQKFPQVPAYILENERLNGLAEWAARRAWLNRSNPVMIMGPGGGGRDMDPDPSEKIPHRGQKPDNKTTDSVDPIKNLITEAADCLSESPWSIEMAGGVFPVGPKVCLDRACADVLEAVLSDRASCAISDMLTAALKARIVGASLSGVGGAVFTSAGGWVGLALLHFSVHWAILIATNKTANGVCLIHFFPWISPVFGGILNGYAVGR